MDDRAALRVAFVLNSLGAGGTERSTAVLLPRLCERGIDPVVITLLERDEGDGRRVREAGVDVHGVGARRTAGRVREVRRMLRRLRPDVVHTAIFEADVVGRAAAAGTGIPVVSSLVNTPYDPARRRDPNVTRWKLRAVREVDRVTGRLLTARFHAVTDGVAADGAATLGYPWNRIVVVERGRDPAELGERSDERRKEVRARLGIDPDAALVVAVGRQEFQKGHVHLVDAMRLLAERRPGVVALVAGRAGNATGAIRTAIVQNDATDLVRVLGHRDDVADLLAAADVFVLPSLYEGTAGAAIEALALGTPIVASRLAGTVGLLVDRRNALLVRAGDARDLANAIEEVLADPAGAAERSGVGREMFAARFTLEGSADRMAALYRDVAAEPARPAFVLPGWRR